MAERSAHELWTFAMACIYNTTEAFLGTLTTRDRPVWPNLQSSYQPESTPITARLVPPEPAEPRPEALGRRPLWLWVGICHVDELSNGDFGQGHNGRLLPELVAEVQDEHEHDGEVV